MKGDGRAATGMSLVETAVFAIHLVFAGFWTGSVLFVALWVVPTAARGELNAEPLESVAGSFRTYSRTSALVLFLTGGHMAADIYTLDSLTGTGRGHLVLTMLGLWFVLAALAEIGAGRLVDGAGDGKVREPGRSARTIFRAAGIVAVLLLVDAGLLAAGFSFG